MNFSILLSALIIAQIIQWLPVARTIPTIRTPGILRETVLSLKEFATFLFSRKRSTYHFTAQIFHVPTNRTVTALILCSYRFGDMNNRCDMHSGDVGRGMVESIGLVTFLYDVLVTKNLAMSMPCLYVKMLLNLCSGEFKHVGLALMTAVHHIATHYKKGRLFNGNVALDSMPSANAFYENIGMVSPYDEDPSSILNVYISEGASRNKITSNVVQLNLIN